MEKARLEKSEKSQIIFHQSEKPPVTNIMKIKSASPKVTEKIPAEPALIIGNSLVVQPKTQDYVGNDIDLYRILDDKEDRTTVMVRNIPNKFK
jgi:hypothetical protein